MDKDRQLAKQLRDLAANSDDVTAAVLRKRADELEPPSPGLLHIELVHWQAKPPHLPHTDLWIARIVGVNGVKHECDESLGGSLEWGSLEYARQDAAEWAAMLGCPIVEKEGGERLDGMPPP